MRHLRQKLGHESAWVPPRKATDGLEPNTRVLFWVLYDLFEAIFDGRSPVGKPGGFDGYVAVGSVVSINIVAELPLRAGAVDGLGGLNATEEELLPSGQMLSLDRVGMKGNVRAPKPV
jgi:hypothetical protein